MEKGKFLNSLLFKHLVITCKDQELIEILSINEDPVEVLLDMTEDTYELDPNFFSLDKLITEKVFNCLKHYRFDPEYRKKYSDRINETISNLNNIDSMSSQQRQITYNRYLNLQRYLRNYNIENKHELMNLLQADVVIYNSLVKDEWNVDTLYLIEEATSYYLHNCKELYEDEDFFNNSFKELEKEYACDSVIVKAKRKSLIKKMNKLKK
jgi:hypothetical protein